MEPFFILSSILLWVVVILNIILTLALVRKVNSLSSAGRTFASQSLTALDKGTPAPDFTAQNLNGDTVTLATFRGRSVAFLFVSPGCAPCRESLPLYEKLYPYAMSNGTQLVLVSSGNSQAARDLVDEFSLQMPVLIAPQPENPFFKDYKVSGTPTYCLIGADGMVQSAGYPSFKGGEWQVLAQSWEAPKLNEPQAVRPIASEGR